MYVRKIHMHTHLHGLDVESACMVNAIGLWIIRQLPVKMKQM